MPAPKGAERCACAGHRGSVPPWGSRDPLSHSTGREATAPGSAAVPGRGQLARGLLRMPGWKWREVLRSEGASLEGKH